MNKKNNEVLEFTSLFNYDYRFYKIRMIYSVYVL